MYVAYIHQHFSTTKGSTGTRSYEMSQRLLARGHRVSMICGVNDATASCFRLTGRLSQMDIDGIDVRCVAEPYSNKMGFVRRVLSFGRFARTAAEIVASLGVDLVFATSTPLTVGLPGLKAARRLGVPFVFEVRDLWPELPIAMGIIKNPVLQWYTRRMERRIYRAARWIIALAPGMKNAIAACGYPVDRITMIPNGCDLALFRPSSAPLTDPRFGPPDAFRAVFTGAHGLANGLDAVLDAAAELKRRGVRDIRLIFIGQGSQKPRLVERSHREGLDELICWVDPVPKEELAAVLPHMQLGLMILKNVPAFYYGTSPNKFFDYIASGMPVVNNYPGWLADLIHTHELGAAVPPEDPRALADALLWLRDHPDERREMGRRARQLAEAQFNRDRLANQFVDTLEQVHAGVGGKRT